MTHRICTCMNGLLPAETLRATPPRQMRRAGSVVIGLIFILAVVPLCSNVRVHRLQRVAFANSLPSTERAACLVAASSLVGNCRPAVLLPCWTAVAEPENLLITLLGSVLGKVSPRCIAFMVPFCQKSFASRVLAVCKGWVINPLLAACRVSTVGTAPRFADSSIRCLRPSVATHLTQPTKILMGVCHNTVRGVTISFTVPLSCNQGSLGCQGVVLAHFAAAALRTPVAIAPVRNNCFQSVQVAVWTLITYPPDFPATHWGNFDRA